jgi:subtilase family serine protease
VRDGGDRLVGKRSVPILPAGACSTGTANLTVAAAVRLGTYHLLACADQPAAVSEGNEADNCRAAAGVVDVRAPDLVVTTLAVPPGPVSPGGALAVSDTVHNQGTGDSGPSTTRFYLSRDVKKTAIDARLTEVRAVPSLAVGATSSGSTSVTVPVGTMPGAYYLIACADDLKKVAESAAWEKNNCRVSASAIAVSP